MIYAFRLASIYYWRKVGLAKMLLYAVASKSRQSKCRIVRFWVNQRVAIERIERRVIDTADARL